jgi:hypothetical protein
MLSKLDMLSALHGTLFDEYFDIQIEWEQAMSVFTLMDFG